MSGGAAELVVAWGDPTMSGSLDAGGFVLPTGTVAFLLTDVEGSTKMWEAEPDAMAAAMERHNAILGDAVSAHGGVCPPAQGEGDSIVAAFSRASDAVLAARDAQRALVDESWPTSTALRVRMAVHAGEARTASDGNYAGQAIIRTARLRAIAHGGQVLVSAPARDLIVDHLGDAVSLADLGEHRLRDLARPEHVYQLAGDGLERDFPTLASLDVHEHNLPVQLSTFIGRAEEIASVVALLDGNNRLVTIVGTGGAGKTRLAQQVAAEVVGDQPDGTWWVELAHVSDPEMVVAEVAAVVSSADRAGPGAFEMLSDSLRDRALLIVIDNCEHVVDACARLIDHLLRHCPGVRVLATSREPLEVSGEVAWRIPPLGVPLESSGIAVASLSQFDSVRLFLDRAQKVRPNFHLNDENAAAVAGICQRLDGIPLAVELAAARCRSLSPEQILDGLNDAFRLLTGGGRASLARQATLEASINWSYELLTGPEQALLARLSVFTGGCTLDDAEAICSDHDLPAADVLDLLDRLVAQSLVVLDTERATPRYRVLETVRQYGVAKLDAANELSDMRLRHADHYANRLVDRVPDWIEGDHFETIRLGAVERDNTMAALDTLAAAGQWDQHARALLAFFWAGFMVAPGQTKYALERATNVGVFEDPRSAIGVRTGLGMMKILSFGADGIADLQAVIPLAEAAGFEVDAALAQSWIATMLSAVAVSLADPIFDDAIARARRAGSLFVEGHAGQGRAQALVAYRGDIRAAERVIDATWPLLAGYDDGTAALNLRVTAAMRGWFAGDVDEAERRIAAPLRWIEDVCSLDTRGAETVRTTFFGAITAMVEALCVLSRGGSVDVVRLTELARASGRDQLRQGEVLFNFVVGLHYLLHNDVVAADPFLKESGARAREAGFTVMAALADLYGAHRALAVGNPDDVMRLRAESVVSESAFVDAQAFMLDGWICVAQSDTTAATAHAHETLSLSTEHGYQSVYIEALELLAVIASEDGDPREFARLAGAAARGRDNLGYRMRFPGCALRSDSAHDAAVAALGDEFEAAFDAGRAMSLDEAVAYVERTRGERKRPTLGWSSLTPTETKVVDAVVAGKSNPQIAEHLLMGRETVKTHLSSVFTKLGVANRTQLAAAAIERRNA